MKKLIAALAVAILVAVAPAQAAWIEVDKIVDYETMSTVETFVNTDNITQIAEYLTYNDHQVRRISFVGQSQSIDVTQSLATVMNFNQ